MLPLALLLALPLQDPAAGVEPAQPLPSDPAAAALLAAVATAQFAGHAGREVDGFGVELRLREFGETPHDYGFGLSYARRGPLEDLVLRVDDPERGASVRKGWDGTRYWLQEGDAPRQDLSAREFEADRDSIDEALELAADLLLALDFAELARRAEGLSLAAGPEGERLVSGRVRRGGHLWDFTLALPARDGPLGPLPSDLFLRRLNEDPATKAAEPVLLERHIAFSHYKRFAGRATPQLLHEYLPSETAPARTLEVHDLRWTDAALKPASAPVEGAL